METAENLSIILGDLLLAEEETVTHPMMLLQQVMIIISSNTCLDYLPVPPIRTVVCILP